MGTQNSNQLKQFNRLGGALEHFTMAEVADKDIVSKITGTVKTLTLNIASLTAQLINAMKLNVKMANNKNFNPTQNQN